jgi:hypothetical protein
MTRRPRMTPPLWFKWAIWAAITAAVALPTACMMMDGRVPTVSTRDRDPS